LVARVVDLLRLAEPGGADWLGHGALSLGAGQGIAWTEMARGLLVHWVRLDGGHAHPQVAACRVLAPTEWNFHPQGVLARALQALPPAPASGTAATRLAVAFDPCVSFRITPAAELGEDAPMATEHGKHA
jgi:coenzyme F420-reducing hydrogenase alpha subunit